MSNEVNERQTPTEESVSRRGFFHGLGAAAVAGAGAVSLEAQEHAHHAVSEEKKATGAYTAKFFTAHEMATMKRLAELTIPADEGGPSAADVGAHEFIDLICSKADEIGNAYTGGLLWLDGAMLSRYGKKFLEAAPGEQTAMLDLIAFRKNDTAELRPGIEFFTRARRMIADGYYTTRQGVKDLGFLGNKATMKWDVPAASLTYALEREKRR
ncbi:MAG: gluconate 2-dehydrogenase subunit 3 family protein [Bryobacterales bacterium]|nr:gluconate 2-dehydrogenase subunit 3 family protein [Bryobacterales bacterium]